MSSMREIRQRIRIIKNIEQITKAMKMVAVARLRKAQERAESSRPYAERLNSLVSSLSSAVSGVDHPLLEVREPKNIGVLVVSGERGLAGSYNVNLFRETESLLMDYDPEQVKLIVIGNKGNAYFNSRGYKIIQHFPLPATEVDAGFLRNISREVTRLFESQSVDIIYVVYTRFVTAMTQIPTTAKLLPLETVAGEEKMDYLFEPNRTELLKSLLPRYLDAQILDALLESIASEHGARMTSMTAATDNAGEMIQHLTLSYNRARQAAITTELTEIVGGASALEG